jgi:PAS domain S-box-containing protein
MGEDVYTLHGAETPYRLLIEAMNEGAATLSEDGTVLYCNLRFAAMLNEPLQNVLGSSLRRFLAPADLPAFDALLAQGKLVSSKGELSLQCAGASAIPVQLSFSVLDVQGAHGACVVATDLTDRKRAELALREAHNTLEQRVRERTAELLASNKELNAFNNAMVGRELRMIELKKEIDALCVQFGQPPRYGYGERQQK